MTLAVLLLLAIATAGVVTALTWRWTPHVGPNPPAAMEAAREAGGAMRRHPGLGLTLALIAIVGGIGTASGPILGAVLVVALEEAANALLSGQVAGLSNLVYGLILIAVILIQPHGLVALRPMRRRVGRGSR